MACRTLVQIREPEIYVEEDAYGLPGVSKRSRRRHKGRRTDKTRRHLRRMARQELKTLCALSCRDWTGAPGA